MATSPLNVYRINKSQIDSWLWIARHQIRKGNPRLACEAMLTALWLMGAA